MIRRKSIVQSVLCVSQPRTHFLAPSLHLKPILLTEARHRLPSPSPTSFPFLVCFSIPASPLPGRSVEG